MNLSEPAPENPEAMRARLEHEDRILEMKLRVWERAVGTQRHFNEMAVKSRRMGLKTQRKSCRGSIRSRLSSRQPLASC